ncbi:MAG: septum formation initiator family protein [Pseudomonadota bacterium]
MRKLIEHRYLLRQNMLGIIAISLTIYFSYHLIAGPRGYLELKQLEYQIEQASADLNELEIERAAIEKKVKMMRPGSIDRDLLEERVKHVLGYTAEDEYILLPNRS